jgi:hypothetical protein
MTRRKMFAALFGAPTVAMPPNPETCGCGIGLATSAWHEVGR